MKLYTVTLWFTTRVLGWNGRYDRRMRITCIATGPSKALECATEVMIKRNHSAVLRDSDEYAPNITEHETTYVVMEG